MHARSLSALASLALALAGCLSDSASVDKASVDALASPAAAPAEIPVSIDGSFGAFVRACTITCATTQAIGPSQTVFEQAVNVSLSKANLTATWKPSSPAMETLFLSVFACSGGCETQDDMGERHVVKGRSPLVLDAGGLAVKEGETVYVSMWVASLLPSPGYLAVSTPQEFHVEGSLIPAQAAPAASPSG